MSYANNVCNLFSQLGARGVSVLVASGDSGVGTTCMEGTAKQFSTSFPASCPFVTVVGGTTGNSPENAWSGSGGGFSSVFGRPSYQNSAVNSWLMNDKTHAGVSQYFNSSGRAYPDVAAQSTNFVIVASGASELVSGTSAATPTFASIIQLLNSDRVAAGKAPLGFLNPWLYSTGTSGLTDIKSGKNTGCSGVISGAGFLAVAVCLLFFQSSLTNLALEGLGSCHWSWNSKLRIPVNHFSINLSSPGTDDGQVRTITNWILATLHILLLM